MHVCEVVRIDQSCIWVYIRDCYFVIVLIIILDEIQFLLEDSLFLLCLLQSIVCVLELLCVSSWYQSIDPYQWLPRLHLLPLVQLLL